MRSGLGLGLGMQGGGGGAQQEEVCGKKGMMVYGVVERDWAGRSRRRLRG